MDVRMPGMDGIEATRRISRRPPAATRVLILTTFDLDEYAYAGLRAGASGFLLKDVPPTDLLSAIRAVASGDAVVAPAVTRRLLAAFLPHLPDPGRGPEPTLPPEVIRADRAGTRDPHRGRGQQGCPIAGHRRAASVLAGTCSSCHRQRRRDLDKLDQRTRARAGDPATS